MSKGEIKTTDSRILIQLDKSDIKLLEEIADRQHRSRSNLIRLILERYLEQYK